MTNCDRDAVANFDYSKLGTEFDRLSKPAKRALVSARILDGKALATWKREDVAGLHGIGPSAFPVLEAALAARRLTFRDE